MLIAGAISKAAIVADFNAQVRLPVRAAVLAVGGRWGAENLPWAGGSGTGGHNIWSPSAHALLGSINFDPLLPWPGYENSTASGSTATTNAFFIMHGFALRLTRYRLGNGWLRFGADNLAFLGTQLTCYAANNIVWFNPPAMPAPGANVTALDVNNFLTALKTSVDDIRAGVGAPAADFVGCHSNCHSSCHGSRGRR